MNKNIKTREHKNRAKISFVVFLCSCALAFSGFLSPVYARGQECNKCEQECRLNGYPAPQDTQRCMREDLVQNHGIPTCRNCAAPPSGGLLYCWCKPAQDPSKGLCENHTKKDNKGDGPFQDCNDCQDYCEALGGGRSNAFCDFSYTDRNKEAQCQATGGTTPPAAPANAGSPTDLFNPLGQNTTLFTLIGRLIRSVIGIVGALALLMFIYGGILWITSGGSETRVKQAKGILVNSTVGLLIIFFSYTIISLFFGLFGV